MGLILSTSTHFSCPSCYCYHQWRLLAPAVQLYAHIHSLIYPIFLVRSRAFYDRLTAAVSRQSNHIQNNIQRSGLVYCEYLYITYDLDEKKIIYMVPILIDQNMKTNVFTRTSYRERPACISAVNRGCRSLQKGEPSKPFNIRVLV